MLGRASSPEEWTQPNHDTLSSADFGLRSRPILYIDRCGGFGPDDDVDGHPCYSGVI